MKRKASLSMETIVVAALLLVVLIVLIAVFKDQIVGAFKGYDEVEDQAGSFAGESCKVLFLHRDCYEKCPSISDEEGGDKYRYDQVPPPKDGWDCGKGEVCCERVRIS